LSSRLPTALALAGLVALPACQSADDRLNPPLPGPRERLDFAAAGIPATPPTEYPSLHTVPPRAKLSYTVQQQRAIVDGLVADRELARYTDQVVRYRSGQSSLPPPPEPPHAVAALETEDLIAPAEPAPASESPAAPATPPTLDGDDGELGYGLNRDEDEDTLDSFVDELARDPLQQQSDEVGVPGAPEEEPAEDGGEGLLDWFGGLFSKAKAAAAAGVAALAAVPAMQPASVAAAAVPPDDLRPRPAPGGPGIAVGPDGIGIEGGAAGASKAGEVIASTAVVAGMPAVQIDFAPRSDALPAGAGAQLAQVLAQANAQQAVIRILGEAEEPALALDRARAVGLALVGLGARASDLELTLSPDARADQARLLLAGPGSR
jgi:hypothetical protein